MTTSTLGKATRDLAVHWQRVELLWRDARSAQFYEQYLDPLPDTVKTAEGLMDELGKLLNKIRHDCE